MNNPAESAGLPLAVGLGAVAAVSREGALATYGLGSCVAVLLYDQEARVAGLAHVVLPGPAAFSADYPGKYADSGVPFLCQSVVGLGARQSKLVAKIVGGAQVLQGLAAPGGVDIGQRNAQAVREALARLAVPVLAAEVGGNKGRTVRFDLADMRFWVTPSGERARTL